ncbi:tetratricopeptide repeat protein [Pseudanabaena sp. BC1403]|uniref:CHAT domain-containing protein n=1 Tax=Pseudanabaena sp. BC1403 TaxID=2043171 RepID=UPI0015E1781C|nr:tetratricopeptide repeat protein [Pseudanabaena sp. BC1403]
MNLRSRYGLSLSAISLVVCPLWMSVVTFPEVVFGAEVQELRSDFGLVAQATGDRKEEADRLFKQGNQQYQISQFEAALQSYQQALNIYREIKDRRGEGAALGTLGEAYRVLGKYDKAIELHLQSLEIAREIKDRFDEVQSLGNLGIVYISLGKYDKAIKSQLQRLEIAREIKDRIGEGAALGNLGIAYKNLGKYDKAINYQLQRLVISREIKDRLGEGAALGNLGNAYYYLGKYDEAINYHLQLLAIAREIKYRLGEEGALGNLGIAYSALGKYDKAIEFYLQSLEIAREIKSRHGEGQSLGSLGNAYYYLGKYDKAIEFHLQSLAITREIKDRRGEGQSLGSLGIAYSALGKYDKAIEFQLQSLVIAREIKDRSGEMYGLNNLASAYEKLNRNREAMISYQQALTIAREISDRRLEGLALANLGDVLSRAKRPELAILFYKQSINVREAIRKDISKLDKDIQKSYLATVENTYRNLADLLLKQDRILEAQQVLDLLKVEELNEYLKNVRGNEQTAQGVDLQSPEQNIIALGNELTALQQLAELTPAQKQRLSELTNQEINRNEQFNAFLNTPLIQKQLEELRRIEKAENVDIEKFNRLRSNLRKVKNAVILYPLILEDRLELIIITANTPPIRKTTKIKREQLNTAIAGFLSNLRDPSSPNVEKDAQQLYEWIIKPFETELQQANIQTIIYAPDGQLRYIPLAALHDGKQWLVEKYRINNITASSLTDFTPRDYSELPSVLAAAATNSHNIKLGDRSIPFGALPATKTEVEAIATLLPKTTTLIDQQFSKNVTLQEMKRNTIIHLATHGYFAVGRAEDSFIIFGDGDKATLTDIANWSLTNVSLVVLSACETAIGGKLGSGVEILGLGYRIQDAGAGAAIASLWKVSDDGTSELMQKLYKNLSQKNISSSEALRQAQIAMIRSNKKATSRDRTGIRIVETVPSPQVGQLSHPYYWSAFILIGNGF